MPRDSDPSATSEQMIPLMHDTNDCTFASPFNNNTAIVGPSNSPNNSDDDDDDAVHRKEEDSTKRHQSMLKKNIKALTRAVKERNPGDLKIGLSTMGPDTSLLFLWQEIIMAKWMDGAKMLITEAQTALNACDKEGRYPLHLAIMAAWSAGVEEMVARGADITAMTREGRSVLRLAGDVRSMEILTCLLEKAKEKDVMEQLNEPAADKMRPTYSFVKSGWLEGVQEMLKHWEEAITEKSAEAFPAQNKRTKYQFYCRDRTILHCAAEACDAKKMHEDCAKEKNKSKKMKKEKNRADTKKKNLDFLMVLLEKVKECGPLNAPDSLGFLPLHLAVKKGWTEGVDALLKAGAYVNPRTSDGNTAIHLAVEIKNEAILDAVLQKAATCEKPYHLENIINIETKEKLTALHLAVSNSWPYGVKKLLTAGADARAKLKTSQGQMAIHLAAQQKKKQVLKELLSYLEEKKMVKQIINEVDGNGHSPLFLAIFTPNKDNVKLLLKHGADVMKTVRNENMKLQNIAVNRRTILHCVAEVGEPDIMQILFDHDKKAMDKIRDVTSAGKTALHISVINENARCVEILLTHGVDIHVETTDKIIGFEEIKINALHLAAVKGNVEVCKVFTKYFKNLKKECTELVAEKYAIVQYMECLVLSQDVLEGVNFQNLLRLIWRSILSGSASFNEYRAVWERFNFQKQIKKLKSLNEELKEANDSKLENDRSKMTDDRLLEAEMNKAKNEINIDNEFGNENGKKITKLEADLKSKNRKQTFYDAKLKMLKKNLKGSDAVMKSVEGRTKSASISTTENNNAHMLKLLNKKYNHLIRMKGNVEKKCEQFVYSKEELCSELKSEMNKLRVDLKSSFRDQYCRMMIELFKEEDDTKKNKEYVKLIDDVEKSLSNRGNPLRSILKPLIEVGLTLPEDDFLRVPLRKINRLLDEKTRKELTLMYHLETHETTIESILKSNANAISEEDINRLNTLEELNTVDRDLAQSIRNFWLIEKTREQENEKTEKTVKDTLSRICDIVGKKIQSVLEEDMKKEFAKMKDMQKYVQKTVNLKKLNIKKTFNSDRFFDDLWMDLMSPNTEQKSKYSPEEKLNILYDFNLQHSLETCVKHEDVIMLMIRNSLEEEVKQTVIKLENEEDTLAEADGNRSSEKKKGKSLERIGKPDGKRTSPWLNKIIAIMSEEAVMFQVKKILEFQDNTNVNETLRALLTKIDNVFLNETINLSIDHLSFESIRQKFVDNISKHYDANTIKLPPEVLAFVKGMIRKPEENQEPKVVVHNGLTEERRKRVLKWRAQIFNSEWDSIKNEYDSVEERLKTIKKKLSLINHQPPGGFTPLQIACKLRINSDCIKSLIEAGADLSMTCKENGKERTAIDLLICRVPGAVELLENTFDGAINKSKQYCQVDYKILLPGIDEEEDRKTNQSNMKVLDSLVKAGDKFRQQKLLDHPLVTSFLYLQWKKISFPYYFHTFMFGLFLIFLNCLVLNRYFFGSDRLFDTIIGAWTIFMLILLAIPEVIYIISIRLRRNYIEFIMKLVCYSLTVPVIFIPACPREVGAFAVLLAWLEVIFLVSRIPHYGYYMLIFLEVSNNFFKFIVSFAFLIFGFAITFMITFKGNKAFNSTNNALTKTVVMMTNEFEYDSLFESFSGDSMFSFPFAQFVFLLFVFIVGIVLTNLLIAKAVIETPKISRLRQRADFISMHEKMFSVLYFPMLSLFFGYKPNSNVVLQLHIPLNEMKEQEISFGVKLTNAILEQGAKTVKKMCTKCNIEKYEQEKHILHLCVKKWKKFDGSIKMKPKTRNGRNEEMCHRGNQLNDQDQG